MSEQTSTPPAIPGLQFDRAVVSTGDVSSGVACASCSRPIGTLYYTLGQKAFCPACKMATERAIAAADDPATFIKAVVYGLGAAIVGGIIYFLVMALLHLEIGLVAILIGYMVAKAIRKAALACGRRYQILAVVLTYSAVGLAYVAAVGDLSGFVLPVTQLASGTGILGVLIIGFGLRQAWRLTAGLDLSFVGPLKVAPATPA